MVEFLNEIAFNGILFYVQLNKIWFHELLWSDIYIYLQYFSWLLPKCGTSNTDLYSSTCLCITYYILWQLKLENKNLFCFNGTNFRKMSMNFEQWKIFGIQFLYAGQEECSFLTKRIFFFHYICNVLRCTTSTGAWMNNRGHSDEQCRYFVTLADASRRMEPLVRVLDSIPYTK